MSAFLTPVPLPSGNGTRWCIVWPKIGRPLSHISLSSKIVGLWSHWMDGYSHPCLSPAGCPGCESDRTTGRRRYWAGYLCVWNRKEAAREVLMLPKRTVESSLTLRDIAVDLRGSQIESCRIGQKAAGPVQAVVRLGVERVPADSEEPDTLSVLESIWRVMYPETFGGVPLGDQT